MSRYALELLQVAREQYSQLAPSLQTQVDFFLSLLSRNPDAPISVYSGYAEQ
jgi:hypothetical protein